MKNWFDLYFELRHEINKIIVLSEDNASLANFVRQCVMDKLAEMQQEVEEQNVED